MPRLWALGALTLLLLPACGGKKSPTEPPAAPTGSLYVEVQGLPTGVDAAVTVQGPSSFQRVLAASSELRSLPPGSYGIAAVSVTTAQGQYSPTPGWQELEVQADRRSEASVNYSPPASSGPDLFVTTAYLVQATQRLDGGVPLVAGRDAMLRIFVLANQSLQATPQVRATLYDGQSNQLATELIAATTNSVGIAVNQSNLAQSWNWRVDGQYVQPGLSVQVEVDPANLIEESNEGNNRWPAVDPKAIEVQALDDLQIRFVPVHQLATGLTGDVNVSNAADFLPIALKLWPTAGISFDVRSTYSSTSQALLSDDANDAWDDVLREIWALRQVENPSGRRHYYGVVDVSYGSGVAGLAYLSAYAGIGRDLSFPSLQIVFPHELGHNLSLPHAACGVAGGDPAYPYPNGQIGVYGLDTDLSLVKAPDLVDIMSYCNNVWISDYNFEQALEWRASQAKRPTQQVGDEVESCYLVWGSIHDGGIELEPVVELRTRAVLPSGGEYEVELTRADGEIRSLRFDPVVLADGGRPGAAHFAWLLPRADFVGDSALQSVSVRGKGHGAVIEAGAAKTTSAARVERLGADLLIEWDAQRWPLLVARDADSGEILSLATKGRLLLPEAPARVELSSSDGLRSERSVFER